MRTLGPTAQEARPAAVSGVGLPDKVQPSDLGQWPVQLHLVPTRAPFFQDRELLVLATCGPVVSADVHWRYLRGRSVVVACPKLDLTGPYVEKLTAIMAENRIPRVVVVRLQVPCCGGLTQMVLEAHSLCGRKDLVVEEAILSVDGSVMRQEVVAGPGAANSGIGAPEVAPGRRLPIGPRGAASYAGTLSIVFTPPVGGPVPGLAGAKTAAAGTGACEGKGSFGLFYTALPASSGAVVEAVVDGLQQTATTRSNLALINPSSLNAVVVQYEVWDGATGVKAFTSVPIELPPLGWMQVDRVLLGAAVTQGFVRLRRTSAGGVFAAYGVLNDGASPGARTGDGSYVAGVAYYPPD